MTSGANLGLALAEVLPTLALPMSSKVFNVAAMAGDGIGPEVMREAIKVLRAVGKKFSLTFNLTEAPVGWAGIDAAGKALPDDTLALCRKSDCILFGSVGLPDRDPTIPKEERPERAALLRLRKEFGLFANLRPVKLYKELAHACPLRDVQEAASHADPRTAVRYDRACVSLDRHATYIVSTFIAGAAR